MTAPALPMPAVPNVPRLPGGNTSWAARYGALMREIHDRQADRQPRSLQVHLGPSEVGSVCDRQIVGKMTGAKHTNHVTSKWPATVGTGVHVQLAQFFANENLLNQNERWHPEIRVMPVPEHAGTSDLYDELEYAAVDHKGIAVDTPVPTPGGWTAAGRLQPGDTVFGADGRPCKVIRTYPVQYRGCYRITFDDRSELITDDVQEFPFVTVRGRNLHQTPMSATAARGNVWSRTARPYRQLRLYNSAPLELPEQDLVVHPYVLGCWLGDGGVHAGTIAKPDDELYEHIRSCGYEVSPPLGKRKLVRTVYGLSTQLQAIGLQWKDSAHPESHGRLAGIKRVPEAYLRGSREQRLSLLQGMMDTDGTWNRKRNQAVFTTTDKQLAEYAAELARSLGWKARILPQQATGFGLTVTAYHVAFTPFGANPFRLSRKANLVRMDGTTRARYRVVRSIEPVLSVPTRCIDVDSGDHLYLAGTEMVPVHNCLGETQIAKLRRKGPSTQYFVQLLLYARGLQNQSKRVDRIVLVAWPRTAPTLAGMYVWEHVLTQDDDIIINQWLSLTRWRAEVASRILAGQLRIEDVPFTPNDGCAFCNLFRPEAAQELARGEPPGPGCPGNSLRR